MCREKNLHVYFLIISFEQKKKETEFSHVRENTNICQREVTKALLQLEKVSVT